jgi:exosortase
MIPIALTAIWLHFFWSLVPSWRFGEYYNYGFLVPVLAFGFVWRRAGLLREIAATPWMPGKWFDWLLALSTVGVLMALIPLRVIETSVIAWRPPLIFHGLLVTGLTLVALVRARGWKTMIFFLPVIVFAWSAVPYFQVLENTLVRHLTGWVLSMTREAFLLGGQPVEQLGERLVLGARVVDVTDGCSGIRSIQSLLMASLFFGELLWLRLPGRILLIGSALVAAVVCNIGRAWYLASVQFAHGEDAAHAVHDTAGHLAFAAAALSLYLTARLLMPRIHGRIVRRRS